MGCQSIAGLPPTFNLLVPIYTPGWGEASAVRVKCPAQEHMSVGFYELLVSESRHGRMIT